MGTLVRCYPHVMLVLKYFYPGLPKEHIHDEANNKKVKLISVQEMLSHTVPLPKYNASWFVP